MHSSCMGGPERDFLPETLAPAVRVSQLPTLGYDETPALRADSLAEEIEGCLQQAGFDKSDSVVHIHNHGLGKNVSLPGAISLLAERGFRFLLQIHDFVEDLRPENYRCFRTALQGADVGEYLYPQAPHIHYALLNSP